ncbi:MAG TPA: DUF6351 family protein [Thermoleophilaceae bacterium]|nr:DUF6351 family protein [Thermoleophilaceae bacterium]
MKRFVFAIAVAGVALIGTATASAAQIDVLSDRADLISGGDALVAVTPANAKVTLNGRDITSEFANRPNGRYEGLVTGLSLGGNTLSAAGARATILNHPIGGPVIAGPQVKPWICQNGSSDPQCNAPTTYSYQYKSSLTGQLQAYDPSSPPSDVATTTTDQGVTVPFIVRTETGYEDRDQYQITTLYQPGQAWQPWAPQRQWNHKLLITHGASCGIDHQSGTAPSTTGDTEGLGGSPTTALGLGFAVMSTALDNAGHNCSLLTEAESLIMAKEHLVESYGELRYTIGTGCSGGSLVQQQVANAYPGIYQGILPQCSFPDAWSTGQQLVDYHLDRAYFENPAKWGTGVAWTPAQIAAVEGHPNHVNAIILDSLYWTALGDPTNPCAGVSDSERWSASNPKGVRCTLADYMVNALGRRPDGYAGRPLDNVGVQYGLTALQQGLITPAQFVDLNAKIGGGDINTQPTAERTAADEPALANAYKGGLVNEANNLKNVAIIDLRGTDQGEFHDVYRAFAIRARLEQQNGTFANQVIWEGVVPLLGDVSYTTQGLLAMDRWLSAVEKDGSARPLSQKIIGDKPVDVHDQCTDGIGQVIPSQSVCQLINPVFSTPRIVAGESIATDVQKCGLKPLRRSDYLPGVQFTDDEWAQLQKAFPAGVCDWSKRGVDQRPTLSWRTYQDAKGNVIYGGTSLGPAPSGSGGGWSSSAFSSWLSG